MESIFFVPLVSVFVKPDDQSQTCLSYGMARKGALKMNVFRFRVYIFMRAALKKSEE